MAMTLRLPEDVDTALREQARRDGLSLHEAIVKAVTDYSSQRAVRRDGLIAEGGERYAALLARLGEGA
jgi:hypothetical protein